MRKLATLALIATLLSACEQQTNEEAAAPADVEEQVRLQLETAGPGTVVTIPEGVHQFARSLTLNRDGVTIRGAGMDRTVLSFKGQVAGAEGLLVSANDFTIEDLAIEDTVGDALKINEGRNIIVRRVRTEWTRGPDSRNGAYGIYPVQTENTLIEDSVAIGASDAGIYVGQSRNVIVRSNRAEFNVAGIEIENTVGADVYDNVAVNNTGGVLVFNMPDLPQDGHSTRVFRNEISGNNTANFGAPGSAVAGVPAGSGVLINANDRVEVFENVIGDNSTANIIISSYFSAGYSEERTPVPTFDPYPETIYIYANVFSPGGDAPGRQDLDELRVAAFGEQGRLPDILWDGLRNPEKMDEAFAICVDNGEAVVFNIDAGNEYQNPGVDMAAHACAHAKLSEIVLAFATGPA